MSGLTLTTKAEPENDNWTIDTCSSCGKSIHYLEAPQNCPYCNSAEY